MGDNTNYNTRSLIHEVDGSSAIFSSINFGSSLSSLSTDNTWGYSYSTNNGTNSINSVNTPSAYYNGVGVAVRCMVSPGS